MSPHSRPIRETERTGVLEPSNLPRLSALWLEPAEAVRDVVDTYWSVAWDLQPGEAIAQRIVDFPSVTFSIESGDVPARFVATPPPRRAWTRVIAGRGVVFAIRLRPAGLAVVSDLQPAAPPRGARGPAAPPRGARGQAAPPNGEPARTALVGEQAVTPTLDPRVHGLLSEVGDEATPAERARCADALIARLLAERPISPLGRLANDAVDALTASTHVGSGRSIAQELNVSERSIQRALRATLGMGPHAVARRIRLQEVVRRISLGGPSTLRGGTGASGPSESTDLLTSQAVVDTHAAAESAAGAAGDAPRTGPAPAAIEMAELAAELGYADQAHLINDFRGVAGVTPGQYARELRATPLPRSGPPG